MRYSNSTPRSSVLCLLLAGLLAFAGVPAAADEPGVHAITGVRIVPSPGSVIEEGTVVLRDGVIEAVGAEVTPPPDARIWEPEGLTVYPGLIDAYGTRSWPALEAENAAPPQDGHPNDWVRPERHMARYGLEPERAAALRKAGFTLAVVAPREGVFRGTGALVSLTDGALPEQIVEPRVTQNVTLRGRGFAALFGDGETYPTSLMGAAALFRQVLLDVDWQRRARAAYARNPAQERPPRSQSLEALADAAAGRQPMVFETSSPVDTLRVLRLAEETGVDPWLLGHGREPERLEELVAAGAPVLLPVDFPEPPEVGEDDDLTVGLDELRRWYWAPETPKRLLDAGVTTALTTHGLDDPGKLHAHLARSIERGLSRDDALAALTTTPARLLGLAHRAGTLEPGKMANLVLTRGELFGDDTEIVETWVEGRRFAEEPPQKDGEAREPDDTKAEKSRKPKKAEAESDAAADLPPVPAPLRPSLPEQPPAVYVQGATIWTAGPQGTLEGADLLVQDGRITAVGRGLDAPAGAVVVDGSGLHVTPGLVDAHSHTAMEDTNEVGDLITSEVRVSDGLDFTDVNLYRQLAGGLTTANVLHGSANPVGGQSAVIKLRWGATDQDLLVDDAEPTIKFALGENPKRSNAPGNPADHFPRSRPGVEQAIRDRFLEARDDAREWEAWENDPDPDRVPPRRDLELEALAEILAGERRIHSHSYRADEILMLLELSKELGFEPPVFQHGLEAYKVADELAAAGASASIFSDWWGYKFEVVDAIPFSGALLTERGVLASFNSDSDELARRLNLEAAKAVRYGGMAPAEALKLVTANPARQLGLDHRIGTLEPGKDGDFVIWSGDPLSTYSRVLETWIEGRKFFDREDDLKRREALRAERRALLERARAAVDGENNKGSESGRTR